MQILSCLVTTRINRLFSSPSKSSMLHRYTYPCLHSTTTCNLSSNKRKRNQKQFACNRLIRKRYYHDDSYSDGNDNDYYNREQKKFNGPLSFLLGAFVMAYYGTLKVTYADKEGKGKKKEFIGSDSHNWKEFLAELSIYLKKEQIELEGIYT